MDSAPKNHTETTHRILKIPITFYGNLSIFGIFTCFGYNIIHANEKIFINDKRWISGHHNHALRLLDHLYKTTRSKIIAISSFWRLICSYAFMP